MRHRAQRQSVATSCRRQPQRWQKHYGQVAFESKLCLPAGRNARAPVRWLWMEYFQVHWRLLFSESILALRKLCAYWSSAQLHKEGCGQWPGCAHSRCLPVHQWMRLASASRGHASRGSCKPSRRGPKSFVRQNPSSDPRWQMLDLAHPIGSAGSPPAGLALHTQPETPNRAVWELIVPEKV